MAAVLESRDLYRFYELREGKVAILKGISFALERAEFVTIMGPSGSGKSTLLHLLAGLDLPSAGSVEIAGKNLSACSEEQRAAIRRQQIGFIFQFFNLLPDLSVRENISNLRISCFIRRRWMPTGGFGSTGGCPTHSSRFTRLISTSGIVRTVVIRTNRLHLLVRIGRLTIYDGFFPIRDGIGFSII